MKKLIYLFGLILAISFVACNQDDGLSTDEPQYVEVAFKTTLESGSAGEGFTKASSGTYERPASTPVQVTGIIITAENQRIHDKAQVYVEEFPFAAAGVGGGDPITMTIGVGETDFSAVSTTLITEDITSLQYFDDKEATGTLQEKASAYTTKLQSQQAIYADWATSEVVKRNVMFNTNFFDHVIATDNGLDTWEDIVAHPYYYKGGDYIDVWPGYVDMTLTPQTGRSQIVFESESDLNLRITPVLWDDNDTPDDLDDDTELDATQQLEHQSTTKASAFIFNSSNMLDGTYIKVQVEKFDGVNWIDVATSIIITTQPGYNVTHVINFSGEGTESIGFGLSYSAFSTSNAGSEITN